MADANLRRPKARTRGFIRAYAPILQNVGIDQETFLDFIDQLNKAVEPSPWITAIDLASLAGHAFPEPIHLLISASALMATQITAEVVSRSKSNAFLDKMNQEFFKPKGLIALVVTWKPKKDGTEQNPTGIIDIDMSSAAASKKPVEDAPTGVKRRKSMIQLPSAGAMFELPEHSTAEYVGPAVRQVKLGGKSAGSSVKRTGHFISDYQDRRAVARWSGQHPDSQMAKLAPAPGFQSRFADPNHPAGSGDFVALVTGGKRTTAEVGREAVRATAAAGREGMMRVRSTTERAGLRVGGADGADDGGPPRRIISPRAKEALVEIRPRGDWLPKLPPTATAGVAPKLRRIGSLQLGAPVRTMKKLLQPDILYLMIVNLPTEEEIADAAACLNQQVGFQPFLLARKPLTGGPSIFSIAPQHGNLCGFKNYGLDQAIATKGWDSDKSVPATRREQIANDVDAAHQKWFKCVYGWDKFPFDDVKGNVVGWAVKDKSLLEGFTDIWRASASIPT
ncbi:putative fad binding domain protein [Diaporthe ampelina]|uniref:Putative fad binding domain protein n=1 Tax=Diaporthe ampelina TaxID=1214573 RepID=A0A0G2HL44_9PEZI|nr:putative fad binding domain protein [Diaporthe ampelina]